MEYEKSSNLRKVINPKAAELLTDWRQRRFLEPFVPGPRSMSEAANVLGVKLNALHYRVGQLIELGLLEVVGSVKRKGRAVNLYGPTAKEYFVPFASTPHATVEDMVRRLSALDEFLIHAVATLISQAENWGVLVSQNISEKEPRLLVKLAPLDPQGVPAPRPRKMLLASSTPAVWSGEVLMKLDTETAKALQRELADLTERFEQRQRAGEQPYYVVLGITPITEV
jgi:DNA-binding Lrp family transcriptional regulator